MSRQICLFIIRCAIWFDPATVAEFARTAENLRRAKARTHAAAAYEDAVRRQDTRSIHSTWKALFDATNGELSA